MPGGRDAETAAAAVVGEVRGLIKEQDAAVGVTARAAPPEANAAAGRGLDVGGLHDRTRRRLQNAARFRDAYARYRRPVSGLEGIGLAPFRIPACEGRLTVAERPHSWPLDPLSGLGPAALITPIRHVFVTLAGVRAGGRRLVGAVAGPGGEGVVVEPPRPPTGRPWPGVPTGRPWPGVKVRGRECPRIIYGPDYTK